ncbi:unnamed protein product [Strongylus vulgaris]|uniref:DNA topoisomerase (ATP-hydrolyzing) n=1 Tax=Strongylus vulgaris TaxID=40348 RepID=A0A3P7I1L9_STRVU|nr:unnamed protein product [Strongylus vulgaris]
MPLVLDISTRIEFSTSERLIYKTFSPLTRQIFPAADDELLTYLQEENQLIEPDWYCPIIPMVLVNGAEGVGTGWSTLILNHNIFDVIDNVRRMIDGDEMEKMIPSFSDFSGKIEELAENSYEISGKYKIIPLQRRNAPNLRIEITELPVGEWTNRYKQNTLHALQKIGIISGFKEYHTERNVRFLVELSREFTTRCRRPAGRYSELMKKFKLCTSCVNGLSETFQVLFDPFGRLKNYATIGEIMLEHFHVRQKIYEKRKEHETKMLDAQKRKIENQVWEICEK